MSDKEPESIRIDRLINVKELSHIIGLQRATIYKRINEGKLPKPLKLGAKASRWRLSDIIKYIDQIPQP